MRTRTFLICALVSVGWRASHAREDVIGSVHRMYLDTGFICSGLVGRQGGRDGARRVVGLEEGRIRTTRAARMSSRYRGVNLVSKPDVKPSSPSFSSGPTRKRPGYSLSSLRTDTLGRSHRSSVCQQRLQHAIQLTKEALQLPPDYAVGIVPGGDTGAYEMAMWNLLGDRPVDVLAWDAFGMGWYDDIVNQLKIQDVTLLSAPRYGSLPDLASVRLHPSSSSSSEGSDVCFTWNGTTSGVCVPNGDWIPHDRNGLTLCDATSAAFSMELPWDKLDVTTFSWQKALGGEGAHGVIVLSPRALQRLEECVIPKQRPIPKLFRLTDNKGRVTHSLFEGATINTPSMLCVEDYIDALQWYQAQGGLKVMVQRSKASLRVLERMVEDNSDWMSFLAKDPCTRSTTSVCLELPGLDKKQLKALTSLLEEEEVAYDIGSYRDAPPGLRVWCGATVPTSDVEGLVPWIEWARQQVQ